ncbi:hypothetical protein HUU39_28315 [candidate division KSB1 bacterium]|nr:hypothetical protein [bacterium]NUM69124.1 hypothetical protein [candidate division KSB1 bacterium]
MAHTLGILLSQPSRAHRLRAEKISIPRIACPTPSSRELHQRDARRIPDPYGQMPTVSGGQNSHLCRTRFLGIQIADGEAITETENWNARVRDWHRQSGFIGWQVSRGLAAGTSIGSELWSFSGTSLQTTGIHSTFRTFGAFIPSFGSLLDLLILLQSYLIPHCDFSVALFSLSAFLQTSRKSVSGKGSNTFIPFIPFTL